jgi:hypothetical protein
MIAQRADDGADGHCSPRCRREGLSDQQATKDICEDIPSLMKAAFERHCPIIQPHDCDICGSRMAKAWRLVSIKHDINGQV